MLMTTCAMPGRTYERMRLWILSACLMAAVGCVLGTAQAGVRIEDDPNGYAGIPWGRSLKDADGFTLVDAGERVKRYERSESPSIDGIPVDAVQFFTIDGHFARVIVRYHGKSTHDRLVEYLESTYGALDRTPGQMARGLNIQYGWRGDHTEINLQYQAQGDRGFIFFESRVFAPLFTDLLPEHGY